MPTVVMARVGHSELAGHGHGKCEQLARMSGVHCTFLTSVWEAVDAAAGRTRRLV
ncbi:hypothetical protein D3C80_2233000 [compost metagenome]